MRLVLHATILLNSPLNRKIDVICQLFVLYVGEKAVEVRLGLSEDLIDICQPLLGKLSIGQLHFPMPVHVVLC